MSVPWLLVANNLRGVSEIAGPLSNPKIREMYRISGHPEVRDDEVPWCAAFVGTCLRLAGFKSSGSLGARSYFGFGKKLNKPTHGCVVVFWREDPKSSKGHVAFFEREDKNNIYVLGGNQGNEVSISAYPRNRLLGYFLPIDRGQLAQSNVIPNYQQLSGTSAEFDELGSEEDPNSVANEETTIHNSRSYEAQEGDPRRAATPQWEVGTSDVYNNFGKVQPIIAKWEGGYVDHPKDPGGATNMGVTIATLTRWLGRQATKDEVKSLTRATADRILKTYYYDIVRGNELPIGVAVAVYNAAVLSGPSRAAKWLQGALVVLGQNVFVDGAIGRQTLEAVKGVSEDELMLQVFAKQEAFYRSLSTFKTFGKGWMNRLEDVKLFAESLQQNEELVVSNQFDDSTRQTANVIIPDRRSSDTLTPVNGALGQFLGRLLNGYKTGIGAGGLLGTTLLQQFGPYNNDSALSFLNSSHSTLQTLSIGMLLWGLLGKQEKWMLGMRNR